MKHPREILLERHRTAGPKLDRIRESALATLPAAPGRRGDQDNRSALARGSLRELLRSCRWHLAGLSAAWGVVLLLNADPAHRAAPGLSAQQASSPRPLLTTLRENRRQIAEWIESPMTVSEPAPEPPRFVPKRRGGIQFTNATA